MSQLSVEQHFDRLLLTHRALEPSLRTVALRYKSRRRVDASEEGGWEWAGWWVCADGRLAAFRVELPSGPTGGQTGWMWTVWNGAVSQSVKGESSSSEDAFAVHPVSHVQLAHSRNPKALSYDVGGPLGLYFWHTPWANILGSDSVDCRAIRIEEYLGAECLVVLFDRNPEGSRDGVYDAPGLAWFDISGNGVARRILEFVPTSNVGEDGPITAFMESFQDIDGLRGCVVGKELQMADFADSGVGRLVYPQSMVLQYHNLPKSIPPREIVVEHFDAYGRVGVAEPFSLPFKYPLQVYDRTTRQRFVLGESDGELYSADDFAFWLLAREHYKSLGGTEPPSLVRIGDAPRNCATDAVALLLMANSRRANISELMSALPSAQQGEGSTTPEALLAMLRKVGVDAERESVDLPEFLERDAPGIVAIRAAPGSAVLHFLVAIPKAEGENKAPRALILSPPGRVEEWPIEQLDPLWSGEVIYWSPMAGSSKR